MMAIAEEMVKVVWCKGEKRYEVWDCGVIRP
jgi:hypothetical protein